MAESCFKKVDSRCLNDIFWIFKKCDAVDVFRQQTKNTNLGHIIMQHGGDSTFTLSLISMLGLKA